MNALFRRGEKCIEAMGTTFKTIVFALLITHSFSVSLNLMNSQRICCGVIDQETQLKSNKKKSYRKKESRSNLIDECSIL